MQVLQEFVDAREHAAIMAAVGGSQTLELHKHLLGFSGSRRCFLSESFSVLDVAVRV